MFSHIMIGGDDLSVSKKFYDAVLATVDVPEGVMDPKGRLFYRTPTSVLAISVPIDGAPTTGANGGTIGFACDSPEQADAWHAAGIANGGMNVEDLPGWREGAAGKVYLAYLLVPFGNKICALHR